MKKLLFLLMMACSVIFAVSAQDAAKQKEETKVKKTSTPAQKVHNTFSKHKKYSGHKTKHKVEKA